MKTAYLALLALAACLGCTAAQPGAPGPQGTARVVGYYFGPTAQRGFTANKIDAGRLTHINYAFGRVLEDGSAALANPAVDHANFRALRKLKQRFPHMRILIAFGGWGGSRYFSNAAATPESRARFISSTLDSFLRAHPDVFDGVDLDWEYPVGGGMPTNVARPEDRANLTALVHELRTALDAEGERTGKHYLITMATPAGPAHLAKYEIDQLAQTLDFINVMTYDYHTAGRAAHFNAPLRAGTGDPTPEYSIEGTVAAYRAAGVPDDKLVIGVPFYGYGYGGVPPADHGRFQPAARNGFEDSAVAGPKPKWVGAIRFHQVADALSEGFQRHWDEQARVPWLYHPQKQIWITYDDAESIGEKAAYVRAEGLGGIMIWELSGDNRTLLPVINEQLGIAR